MTLRKLFFFVFLLVCQLGLAQNDTIVLKDVQVSDNYLKKNNSSQNIIELTDSILDNNKPSLTNLLNTNSSIYFKENGYGMVSSPSFRGTTAQQTAVVWNGININSQLTGQTDFNTISTRNFDSVVLKAGGGSAIYGTSAIGGTVHLNNEMTFKNHSKIEFQQDFGSFSTYNSHLNAKVGTSKMAFQIGLSRNSSQNDFKYINVYDWKGNQRKNLNGAYENYNLNGSFGYKINSKNILKYYSQTYSDLRHFSLINDTDTKTKYKNSNYRNLVVFDSNYEQFTSNIKLVYLFENYLYYPNIDSPVTSSGKVGSFVSKFDFGYRLSKSIKVNSIIDYNHAKGFGTSIPNAIREISSFSLILNQKLNRVTTDLSIRKEVSNAYRSPILFSLGSAIKVNSFYEVKANVSSNFRAPTFNDLYYNGSGGIGNLNLKSESALQAEVGNVFKFKRITFSQTVYFIKTKDLISWVPINSMIWSPINTKKVNSYGVESVINWKYNYDKHFFSANATYAYTISKNLETNTQLAYVPFHKFTASLGYTFSRVSLMYQFLYNGFVYTLLDNNPNQIVESYKVSNISTDYNFKLLKSLKIGLQIANIFNQKYQSVEGRYMPGKNFNIFINFKF